MKLLILFLFTIVFSVVFSGSARGTSMIDHLGRSNQIIIVKAKDWNSKEAKLYLSQKKDGKWLPVKQDIPVVLGRNGLGWGRGLDINLMLDKNAPLKREGDGRSPAGVFVIKQAFGFPEKPPSLKLPYIRLTEAIECIDDVNSQYYNRIVDTGKIPSCDWKSSEKMSAVDVYKIGLFIEHNTMPVAKDCGSCIFFHIWEKPDKGTSGCTAMAENDLVFIMEWLDPEANPVLLQVTEETYNGIKRILKLPGYPLESPGFSRGEDVNNG